VRKLALKTLSRPWPAVLLIFGAGVAGSFQLGKASLALAQVKAELGLSLATVSWLVSAFAVVGAVAGVPVGLFADRLGARRMAVDGLVLMGVGSLLGALAPDAASLLAMRVVEGLGFVGVVVAGPALIDAAAPTAIRQRAMALWATFMPFGMTLILLASPLLDLIAWRGFWLLNTALLFLYAAILALSPLPPTPRPERFRPILRDMLDTAVSPGPWTLAGLFGSMSAAYFAMFGLLPMYFSERFGLTNEMAGLVAAAAIAASGFGNLACGQLLARGFGPMRLLFAGFSGIAVCGVGIFGPFSPLPLAFALCILFSFASGLIPVVIFDSAPRLSPRPDLLGVTIGFGMQGSNLGLLAGPPLAGGVAAAFGWSAIAVLIVGIALAAALVVALFHKRRSREYPAVAEKA